MEGNEARWGELMGENGGGRAKDRDLELKASFCGALQCDGN